MSEIKRRIQETAVELFNQKGISSVTMKQIADELSISPGNLTYHYKTKASLVEAIYRKMDEETVDYMEFKGYVTLHHFEEMMNRFYEFNLRYKFFFNDVVFVVRQFPEVAKMYEASNLLRFTAGRSLIDYFVDSGRMVEEGVDTDYDKLIHTIWMVTAFWQAQAQVINSEEYTTNKVKAIDMIWPLMLPHLTEKGKEEYRQMKHYISNNALKN